MIGQLEKRHRCRIRENHQRVYLSSQLSERSSLRNGLPLGLGLCCYASSFGLTRRLTGDEINVYVYSLLNVVHFHSIRIGMKTIILVNQMHLNSPDAVHQNLSQEL